MLLKQKIKEKGWTNERIAKKLGIARCTFQQNLSRNSMSTTTLRKIANIIGCQIGDFFIDEMSDDLPTDQEEYWYISCRVFDRYTSITYEGKLRLSIIRDRISNILGCKPTDIFIINQYQITKNDYLSLNKQASTK